MKQWSSSLQVTAIRVEIKRRVTRGYLGNALKCILGFAYTLGNSKTVFESLDAKYTVEVRPDWQKGRIEHKTMIEKREDNRFTSVEVAFPDTEELLNKPFKDIILATSYANPDQKIVYDIFGDRGERNPSTKKKRIKHRQETCALWYTFDQFDSFSRTTVRRVRR